MRPALLLPAILLACSPSSGSTTSDTALASDSGAANSGDTSVDSGAADSGGDTGLYGDAPSEPIALPDFTATADNGETRTQADLLGQPTVVWFYPQAGSYG